MAILPSGYQEVEYIQSTATNPGSDTSSGQYIDTLVTINKNIKVDIDMQFTSLAVQSRLFGGLYDSGSSGITFTPYINGSTQWARATANGLGNWQSTNVSANTNRNRFVLDNTRYIIYDSNGTQVHNGTNSSTISNSDTWTIPLLASKDRSLNKVNRHSSAKLYGCKIWDNDVLVRDFVPCYRKSDNEIGLYDIVNNQFYANAGTGSFIKGQKILPDWKIKKIYLGTNLIWPGEEVIFDYDFKTTNPSDVLIGNGAAYGYTQISGSGLRTYNVSSNDKRGRAAKQIGEDITNKTIIMDGTWYATFGNTRTGFGMGLRTGHATNTNDNASGIFVHLGTTYYSSFTTYDGLNCPGISSGTGKGVSAFGRTIGTSGNYTVRFLWELNLKSGTSHLEIYRNGTLFSTQDYTLSAADLTLAKGYAASNCYYTAAFERGYSSTTIFMTNWKITIKG